MNEDLRDSEGEHQNISRRNRGESGATGIEIAFESAVTIGDTARGPGAPSGAIAGRASLERNASGNNLGVAGDTRRDRITHPTAAADGEDAQRRSSHDTLDHRSARPTAARGPLASLSFSTASHQSQLRKQAHTSAPRAASRFTSSEVTGIETSGATHFSREGGVSSFSLRSLDAELSERSRSSPVHSFASIGNHPPEERLPSSPINLNSGWSIVETTRGVAGGAPPCQRSLHTAAVLNGCMYVFGGYDGQARVNDFHCFSFAERRWSPVLPSANSGRPPSPRDRHIAVAYANSFYVFGGFDGTSRVSDFFGFDFSSMSWREVVPLTGEPPSPRHSHSGVVHGHSMYVFGGYDGSYRSDFHEFDFNTSSWNVVPAAGRVPRARYRATAVVHKNTMLLFGGHDGTRHLADTHCFDFETRVWSAVVTEGQPPIPRDSHVSVVHGNHMYIFGGSTGSAMADAHDLALSADAATPAKWHQLQTSGAHQPGHRFCHVGVVFRDAMYVFGGYDGSTRLNDFFRFDFPVDDLTFEVPPSTIISDLRAFVNDETLSDVTFIVEGQPVYAHKLMLMRCSYFRAMFMNEMMEAHQSTIQLPQVRYPVFLSIMEFLYTDRVGIPLESAMDLFVAADLFCIPRLKTMCEKRMLQSITVENAATIFHAADLHCATALRHKTLRYILSHFEAVSKTAAFEEMARSNVELVFDILKSR